MNTKQELDNLRASYEAMGARLKELEQKHAEEQHKPWEPKGGDWYVRPGGSVESLTSDDISRMGGTEYPTREAAESAAPYITFFKRLCCLAQELNPSGKVGGEFTVLTSDEGWVAWYYEAGNDFTCLFETQEAARLAADIMNRDNWEVPSCN